MEEKKRKVISFVSRSFKTCLRLSGRLLVEMDNKILIFMRKLFAPLLFVGDMADNVIDRIISFVIELRFFKACCKFGKICLWFGEILIQCLLGKLLNQAKFLEKIFYFLISTPIFLYFTLTAKQYSEDGSLGPVTYILVLILILISFVFWTTVFLYYTIGKPLNELSDITKRVAAGELVTTELSERKDEIGQLARDYNTMVKRLEDMQNKKTEFLKDISHDIRKPLSNIQGYAYMLKNGIPSIDNISIEEAILNQTETLSALVNDFLDLADLDFGDQEWIFQLGDLCSLVRQAANDFRLLEQENLIVDIDIPDEPILVNMKPNKITQIITNLLANAKKHGADGKWVGIRLIDKSDLVRVEVNDRGEGIPLPLNEWDKVFERQYQADPARSKGGSGLGLSIARGFIERHEGGQIGVFPSADGGTCFWFELKKSQ